MYKERVGQKSSVEEEQIPLLPKSISIKPFLKWAGGKTQLLSSLKEYIPKSYNKYIEPFIGGGAFLFYLNPKEAVIADANEELIITYKAIRDNLEDILLILRSYRNEETFYYKTRALDTDTLSKEERAARLLFLNKTCFNGLYRVNKKGEFNVPYAKRNGSFFNENVLRSANRFLQSTKIICADYLKTLGEYAEKEDFIFLDPPYYPVGKYSDFKRYTKDFFYHEDQVKLRDEFVRLDDIGCHVVLTNSNHPVVMELYSDYSIEVFDTKRMISSNPKSRKGKDIIVTNR